MGHDDLPPRIRLFRRVFLVSVSASAIVLVPWIIYLAATLRGRHRTEHWDVAWVGFDAILLVMLATTAIAAMQKRQIVIPAAIVSATLLVTDAWFDIVLDWGDRDIWYSIFSAVAFEIPLAVLLLSAAGRIIHAMLRTAWTAGGRPGHPPRLREARIVDLIEIVATPPPRHEEEHIVLTERS